MFEHGACYTGKKIQSHPKSHLEVVVIFKMLLLLLLLLSFERLYFPPIRSWNSGQTGHNFEIINI